MILDAVLVAALVLYTIFGCLRGFADGFIKTFGRVVSIIFAARVTEPLSKYAAALTTVEDVFTLRAMSFIAGLLFARLAFFGIRLLIGKKYHKDSVIGKADAFFGGLLGFARGALAVIVAVAVLPAAGYLFKTDMPAKQLSESTFALYVMKINPIYPVVAGLEKAEALREVDLRELKELGEEKLKELFFVLEEKF